MCCLLFVIVGCVVGVTYCVLVGVLYAACKGAVSCLLRCCWLLPVGCSLPVALRCCLSVVYWLLSDGRYRFFVACGVLIGVLPPV